VRERRTKHLTYRHSMWLNVHHKSTAKRVAAAPRGVWSGSGIGTHRSRSIVHGAEYTDDETSMKRRHQRHIVRDASSLTHCQGHIVRDTSSGTHRQGNIVRDTSSGTHRQGHIVRTQRQGHIVREGLSWHPLKSSRKMSRN
jgi:hypothetical protein